MVKNQSQLLCEAFDEAGIPCTKHYLTDEQAKRFREGSEYLQEWFRRREEDRIATDEYFRKHPVYFK